MNYSDDILPVLIDGLKTFSTQEKLALIADNKDLSVAGKRSVLDLLKLFKGLDFERDYLYERYALSSFYSHTDSALLVLGFRSLKRWIFSSPSFPATRPFVKV